MGHVKTRIRWAQSRKQQVRNRAVLAERGIPTHVPSAPVRQRIAELEAMGMTSTMIACAAGVVPTTVNFIRSGEWSTTRVKIAAAIMSVNHLPHPAQRHVLAIGCVRRIEALMAMGWKLEELDSLCGVSRGVISNTRRQSAVTYSRWVQIRDLYDRLSATPGTSVITQKRARAAGFVLPMEWEGYDIDDPRVHPPRSARSPRTKARDAAADLRERVKALTEAHASADEIASRTGVSSRTVIRIRSEIRGAVA